MVGDYLSYDPYGIMFRKDDPQLAQVVKDTFQELAADGEIERQYKRWFLRRLPSGTRLNLPMSAQLETIIQTMAGGEAQGAPRDTPLSRSGSAIPRTNANCGSALRKATAA